ncbi:MAG TPA: hypothetical protein VF803_00735 [Candidatus Paceibacterota bacterium]
MEPQTISQYAIDHAMVRINAERASLRQDPIQSHFARAFLELLRQKYRDAPKKNDQRPFEEMMESLLNVMHVRQLDIRHGYKQLAGIIFGERGNRSQARSRVLGAVVPKRTPKRSKPHMSAGGQIKLC